MPVLKKQPQGTSVGKQLPQDVVDEYKKYIEEIKEGEEGILEFQEDEKISLGKEALKQAGSQLGKHLKINKVRGSENLLRFQIITKEEWEEAQRKAMERGEKLKGKPKAKKKR